MQGHCGLADFVWGRLWIFVVLHFVHSIPQQGPNPRLDVPLGNQYDNRVILAAPLQVRSIESIRELFGTDLCFILIGVDHRYQ